MPVKDNEILTKVREVGGKIPQNKLNQIQNNQDKVLTITLKGKAVILNTEMENSFELGVIKEEYLDLISSDYHIEGTVTGGETYVILNNDHERLFEIFDLEDLDPVTKTLITEGRYYAQRKKNGMNLKITI